MYTSIRLGTWTWNPFLDSSEFSVDGASHLLFDEISGESFFSRSDHALGQNHNHATHYNHMTSTFEGYVEAHGKTIYEAVQGTFHQYTRREGTPLWDGNFRDFFSISLF